MGLTLRCHWKLLDIVARRNPIGFSGYISGLPMAIQWLQLDEIMMDYDYVRDCHRDTRCKAYMTVYDYGYRMFNVTVPFDWMTTTWMLNSVATGMKPHIYV